MHIACSLKLDYLKIIYASESLSGAYGLRVFKLYCTLLTPRSSSGSSGKDLYGHQEVYCQYIVNITLEVSR